ncbi:MAG: LysR substrate-binding domain-containing protein [Pseudomonadota bacterium]
MKQNITLKQLIMLDAIAKSGGFRVAAERLAISQPPLSVQMRKLEHAIGADLFDRTEKKTALTPTGALLASQAEHLLAHFDSTINSVRAFARGESGTIRIGFTDEFLDAATMHKLIDFITENPSLHVVTFADASDVLVRRLQNADLDFIMTNLPLADDLGAYEVRKLPPTPMYYIVHTDDTLAKRKRIPLKALHGHPTIIAPSNSEMGFAQQCRKMLAFAGVEPKIVHETDSTEFQLEMTKRGLGGCFFAPYGFVAPSGDTKAIEIDDKFARLDHAAVFDPAKATPAVHRLLQYLGI